MSDRECLYKMLELIDKGFIDTFCLKCIFTCNEAKGDSVGGDCKKLQGDYIKVFLFDHGFVKELIVALIRKRMIHRLGPPRYRDNPAYIVGYYESMNPNRTFIQQQTNDLLRKMVVRRKPLEVIKDILE